jgi:hypothetical protein
MSTKFTLTVEDDDGGIGTDSLVITIWSPHYLKESVIGELKAAKTGDKCTDKRIDHVIKFVKKSLNDKYWINSTHLKPVYGANVFVFELIAVKYMQKFPVTTVFESVILKLVKADEILAKEIFEDAKNSPVKNPKFQDKYNCCLKKAEEHIIKADSKAENQKYHCAITHYSIAWSYAQFAIKWANKKPHYHHKCSR